MLRLASKGIPEPKRLGLEMDDLYYSEVTRLSRIWPDAELLNASNVFRRARLVKTDHELKMMREDGNRQTAVYSKVRHLYRDEYYKGLIEFRKAHSAFRMAKGSEVRENMY